MNIVDDHSDLDLLPQLTEKIHQLIMREMMIEKCSYNHVEF